MDIAIDFDGTIVTHVYPRVGLDIGAFPIMKKLQEKGHRLILLTMRSHDELQMAIDFCKENGVEFFGHNGNPEQDDAETGWAKDSRKVYSHLLIDDTALGVPLKFDGTKSNRNFVDWEAVEDWLKIEGVL